MAYDMTNDEILEAASRITPQWLAGFFDGEGCVSTFKGSSGIPQVCVSIGQSEPKILALIAYKFNGSFCEHPSKNRQHYIVRWHGRSTLPILRFIKDQVICKKRQVEAGIEMALLHEKVRTGSRCMPSHIVNKREELADVIKKSNHGVDTRIVVETASVDTSVEVSR